jgi:hypothetical protein
MILEMKMARSESRKKTEHVPVRATPEEKTELQARAKGFGISVAALCRNAIFGAKLSSVADQNAITELSAARADLGRLGGLLKGWLAGTFPQGVPDSQTRLSVVSLLNQIESSQKQVLDAVYKVSAK